MKILAISDIHGFHTVYRAIPDLAQTHGAELIVLAGDVLSEKSVRKGIQGDHTRSAGSPSFVSQSMSIAYRESGG